MSRLPYVMLACLLGGQVLTAQQSVTKHDVAAELKDLDRQWQDAVVLGDTAFIKERTSVDFVFTHGGGATQTKADWIRIAPAAISRTQDDSRMPVPLAAPAFARSRPA